MADLKSKGVSDALDAISGLTALAMHYERKGDYTAVRRAVAGISEGADSICGRIDQLAGVDRDQDLLASEVSFLFCPPETPGVVPPDWTVADERRWRTHNQNATRDGMIPITRATYKSLQS